MESHPDSTAQQSRPPRSVEELTRKNVETILQLESEAKSRMTGMDRLSSAVARFCGSMVFVWVHIVWFGGWITWNSLSPLSHFDPFPFTFLTLIVSLEAIFLSTFILISQNPDTHSSERRNHLDLQIHLLAEQENTKVLVLLSRIAGKLGLDVSEHPSLGVLVQSTRPDKLVEQIGEADLKCEPGDIHPRRASDPTPS